MKFLCVDLFALCWLGLPRLSRGQNPSFCSDSIEIPEDDFGVAISGSTVNATVTGGCHQQSFESSQKQWYSFNASTDAFYTFLSCADASVAVGGGFTNKVQIRCDSETCESGYSQGLVNPQDLVGYCSDTESTASFTVMKKSENDLQYRGFVQLGFGNETSGEFTTAVIKHEVPSNNFCENAVTLHIGGPPVNGTLFNALPLQDPVWCGPQLNAPVWYSYTGLQGLKMIIRTCPAESGWDHDIDVQGSCGANSCEGGRVEPNPACPSGAGKQKTVSATVKTLLVAVHTSAVWPGGLRGDFTIQVLSENAITTRAPTSSPGSQVTPEPTPASSSDSTAEPTSEPTAEPSSSSRPVSSTITALFLFTTGAFLSMA